MVDHGGQISIPVTVVREPVVVIAIVSYSLACDATDVIDNDNLVTALLAQIQISIALRSMVRNCPLNL